MVLARPKQSATVRAFVKAVARARVLVRCFCSMSLSQKTTRLAHARYVDLLSRRQLRWSAFGRRCQASGSAQRAEVARGASVCGVCRNKRMGRGSEYAEGRNSIETRRRRERGGGLGVRYEPFGIRHSPLGIRHERLGMRGGRGAWFVKWSVDQSWLFDSLFQFSSSVSVSRCLCAEEFCFVLGGEEL
jgi:hypothetical protein